MSKKSPKSIPSEDIQNNDTGKNSTKPTGPRSKEPIKDRDDDDFDTSLYDDDLRLDNFDDDDDDDF